MYKDTSWLVHKQIIINGWYMNLHTSTMIIKRSYVCIRIPVDLCTNKLWLVY